MVECRKMGSGSGDRSVGRLEEAIPVVASYIYIYISNATVAVGYSAGGQGRKQRSLSRSMARDLYTTTLWFFFSSGTWTAACCLLPFSFWQKNNTVDC
jgi:hypothetical protein